jgi:hypothetical protein
MGVHGVLAASSLARRITWEDQRKRGEERKENLRDPALLGDLCSLAFLARFRKFEV